MLLLYLIAGLILLVLGAEWLIRGASRLAAALGLSPLIIGLNVVAFGTSAPELAVSLKAGLSNQGALAAGNVIGSNLFNTLFILGLCALATPLTVSARLVRWDVPVMIALSVAMLLLALDERFVWWEGLLLLGSLVGYTVFQVVQGRAHPDTQETFNGEGARAPGSLPMNAVLTLAGLGLLVLGSRLFVTGAVDLAGRLGISEAVIGLTIVAAGTSLPEVVTSLLATIRGERDIAVGNVLGSNTFNILGVLGVAALADPGGIDVPAAMIHFDMPVLIAVALACLPVFFTRGQISRQEGFCLFAYYIAYTTYLVLDVSGHDALPAYSRAFFWFVIPLNILTWIFVAASVRNRPGGSKAGAEAAGEDPE
ncbi:MAG: calcium/sodium antiporter [Opitutales bacterium]